MSEKMIWRRKRSAKINGAKISAGDEFEIDRKSASLFRSLGWADDAPKRAATYERRDMRATPVVPAPAYQAADLSAEAGKPDDNAVALRAEYQAMFGKRPFLGWDAATLRTKIAAGPKAE